MKNREIYYRSMQRLLSELKSFINKDPKIKIGLIFCVVILIVYTISKLSQSQKVIYRGNNVPQFESGRILNNPQSSFLKGKEQLLVKATKNLMDSQKMLVNRIETMEKKLEEKDIRELKTPTEVEAPTPEQVAYHPSDTPMEQAVVNSSVALPSEPLGFSSQSPSYGRNFSHNLGPSVVSFPVKQNREEKEAVLPAGSYVKAKLMTGVDAPEGNTYPVLLALDYSYIGPNKHRVDLTGCFMIAKTTPSLATERINFQTTKLSCVSKSGKFFEKEVNGFVADDSDNSFAVKAELHSQQGRVMRMAFMKSVVDGIGEIIARKSKGIGGNDPDSPDVMVQNGAQSAAAKVSDWYLNQATSLLPTLSVGSGQDVWVIMQDKVVLPNDFFRKNERRNEDVQVYSYFSRAID